MNKQFAALLDAMDYWVLVEKDSIKKCVRFNLRHHRENYHGETSDRKVREYLHMTLNGSVLARQLLERHVNRWVSDTLERLPIQACLPVASAEPPAIIVWQGDRQVLIESGCHVEPDTGRSRPCIAVRALNDRDHIIRLTHTFPESEDGHLARDAMFQNIWEANEIPEPIHRILNELHVRVVAKSTTTIPPVTFESPKSRS